MQSPWRWAPILSLRLAVRPVQPPLDWQPRPNLGQTVTIQSSLGLQTDWPGLWRTLNAHKRSTVSFRGGAVHWGLARILLYEYNSSAAIGKHLFGIHS